jgi:hypothetical protein
MIELETKQHFYPPIAYIFLRTFKCIEEEWNGRLR